MASRNPGQAGEAGRGDRRHHLRLRGDRTRGGRRPVRRGGARRSGVPDIVVYNASARARGPVDRLDPGGSGARDRGQRLWRVPGGAAGGAADGGARVGGDPADRGVGEREGLSELVRVRDGQVRAARAGAEHGAGVVAAGRACRAFRDRWRRSAARRGPIRTTSRTRCSNPDEIAETYWYVANQQRSAWTWEVELRPWVEKF